MTQLIINGIVLPETSGGKYKCYEGTLSDQIEMISGRVVTEVRGHVQFIEYSYDYMGNELVRQLLSALRAGTALTVKYLPDSGDDMKISTFICEDLTPPVFAFSRSGKPYWHDISFTLREVRPHD